MNGVTNLDDIYTIHAMNEESSHIARVYWKRDMIHAEILRPRHSFRPGDTFHPTVKHSRTSRSNIFPHYVRRPGRSEC